jgi:hypothetical protein
VPALRRAALVALLLALFVSLAVPSAQGALERPTYAPGDRWTYVLTSEVDVAPFLGNETGQASLELAARLDLDVVGAGTVVRGGRTLSTVVVATSLSGFLNGTAVFEQDGFPASVTMTGTVAVNATEAWETDGYWPVASSGQFAYDFEVTFLVTVAFAVDATFNVTASVAHDRTYPLDVGDVATASVETETELTVTVEAFGLPPTTNASSLAAQGTVRREVVAVEEVTVDAGTFEAYRFAQDVVPVGGLGVPGLLLATNETAFFAPAVGNYVRRDLYANGTQVGEMRLKSFRYGEGLAAVLPWLVGGGGAAVVGVAAWWTWRRRRRRTPPDGPPGGAGPPP